MTIRDLCIWPRLDYIIGMSKSESLVIIVLLGAGTLVFPAFRDVALLQSIVMSFCAGLLP